MLDPKLRNNSFDFAAQLNPDPALILRTLAAARDVRAADLPSAATGTVVKIRGVAQPGPDGVLTAPLSGRQCVWYRSVFYPGAGFAPIPSIAPSDGIPALNDSSAHRRAMNPSEEISTAPFRVGGPEGGADCVTVDPLTADVDTDVLAANQMWQGERGFSRGLMVEWVLPVGAAVLATGRLGADRSLQGAPDAALLISTKDEGRIVARDTAGASWNAHGMATTTLKVQRFNNRFMHRYRQVRNVALVLFAVFAVVMVILIAMSHP